MRPVIVIRPLIFFFNLLISITVFNSTEKLRASHTRKRYKWNQITDRRGGSGSRHNKNKRSLFRYWSTHARQPAWMKTGKNRGTLSADKDLIWWLELLRRILENLSLCDLLSKKIYIEQVKTEKLGRLVDQSTPASFDSVVGLSATRIEFNRTLVRKEDRLLADNTAKRNK